MHCGAAVIEPTDEELTQFYLVRLRLEVAGAERSGMGTLGAASPYRCAESRANTDRHSTMSRGYPLMWAARRPRER
jgi:hypothetical protein